MASFTPSSKVEISITFTYLHVGLDRIHVYIICYQCYHIVLQSLILVSSSLRKVLLAWIGSSMVYIFFYYTNSH